MKQIDGIQLKLAGDLDDDVCVALSDELKDLESQLDKIVDFETDGLITRSRCRWAEEGERSSSAFAMWRKGLVKESVSNELLLPTKQLSLTKRISWKKYIIFIVICINTPVLKKAAMIMRLP